MAPCTLGGSLVSATLDALSGFWFPARWSATRVPSSHAFLVGHLFSCPLECSLNGCLLAVASTFYTLIVWFSMLVYPSAELSLGRDARQRCRAPVFLSLLSCLHDDYV